MSVVTIESCLLQPLEALQQQACDVQKFNEVFEEQKTHVRKLTSKSSLPPIPETISQPIINNEMGSGDHLIFMLGPMNTGMQLLASPKCLFLIEEMVMYLREIHNHKRIAGSSHLP